jgi:multicomponent Na+:H+ antiporter subunit E
MIDRLQIRQTADPWPKRLFSMFLQFIILFLFWLVLSGRFEVKYILLGVVSAGLVTYLTNDFFYAVLRYGERTELKIRPILLQIWRFLVYLPWLFSRIIMANVQVAYLVLHPRMPIEPALFLFQTNMRKGIARVTLANSITLTPGTITVDLKKGNYTIHTLKPPLAQELIDAVMQNKVTWVFLEEKDPVPDVKWVYSLTELKS